MNYGKPNHVPVILLVLLDMMLTMFWYSPIVFSDLWSELNYTAQPSLTGTGEWIYLLPLAGAFSLNYIMDWLYRHLNIRKIGKGIGLAVLFWFGFYFLQVTSQYLYSFRHIGLLGIEGGLYLLMFMLAGFVLSIWGRDKILSQPE